MSGGTMTVGQLREALVAYRPETPVMIHPTGDPDDNPVPLSHLGRGALLVEGEQPRPYPMLVVAPVEPHLVAEDVAAGEATAPSDGVIRCEGCGRTTTDPDRWDPEADTGRVFCDACWPTRNDVAVAR